MSYVVRSARGQTVDYGEARRTVSRVSPDAVIERIGAIGDQLGDTVRERTFATLVLGFFGLAGSVVTLAGLVGVVAFVIARRTREIAIRVAIGAGAGHVRRLVTGEATIAAIAGGAVGLLAGQWLSTWLASLVYGIEAGNWITAAGSGLVVVIAMIIAARFAAGRALRIPAAIALRAE
jgi:ABC-type antimicrobial peptide transport system permease subunit